jgi:hypothetical protein
MSTYTQSNRPLAITTPLGKDVLLLTGFRGQEAISQLFNFQVNLVHLVDLVRPSGRRRQSGRRCFFRVRGHRLRVRELWL